MIVLRPAGEVADYFVGFSGVASMINGIAGNVFFVWMTVQLLWLIAAGVILAAMVYYWYFGASPLTLIAAAFLVKVAT